MRRSFSPVLERASRYLLRELRAIGRAPVTFITSVIVAALLISSGLFWSLRQETMTLQHQIAEYRDSLGGASAREAKTALETLADEVSELQARLKPRRMTSTQRQMLGERLKVVPGAQYPVAIVHEGGCWDCPQYAADFDAAFRSIPGWRVSNRVIMGLVQRPSRGLALVLVDPSRPSAQESVVLAALQAAHIEFDVQQPYPSAESGPQLVLSARIAQ